MESTQNGSERFEPGTLIANRYQVVRRLGAGGMGLVLLAQDRKLNNETIAIKLLNKQAALEADGNVLQRMINEVLIARSLTHPNIVRIHDIGETQDGFTYITMEFVEGQTLSDLIQAEGRNGLGLPTALKLLCDILEGVGFAHRKGIIHRDLKPANVLITNEGELKIVDFGLARAAESDMRLTQTGEAVGTPAFMAPEQFRGAAVDNRTDIYALGIMGYQFVTGNLPFQSTTFFDMALKHINAALPDFAEQHGLPLWYEAAVKKATAKAPEERFQSVDEFLQALAEHSEEPAVNLTRLVRLGAEPISAPSAESVYRMQSVHAEHNAPSELQTDSTASISKTRQRAAIGVGLSLLAVAGLFFFLRPETKNNIPAPPAFSADASANVASSKTEQSTKAPSAHAEARNELLGELSSLAAALPEEKLLLVDQNSKATDTSQKTELAKLKTKQEKKKEAPSEPAADTAPRQKTEPKPPSVQVALKQTPPPPAEPQYAAAANIRPTAAKRGGGVDLLSAPRELFRGSLSVFQGDGRTRSLTLDISENGSIIDGQATIDGYGKFKVAGKNFQNGLEMTLVGSSIEIVLSGHRRNETIRGTYKIPQQNASGRWEATLLD